MLKDPTSKIKNIRELKELVCKSQKMGDCVVFANGCFDLIHVGHVRYLEDAKAHGNLLIVGINSDLSVGRLKGYGRPLQPEAERCEILGSFECVDYIVLFDDTTVDNLLLALKPDIHAKGTDYTEESVPERDTVASYGGKVAIVGDAKDHSTRDLINDILSRFC
ncbi:MAG: D-beta-D-heptose 1-phosphate adenosyltransferase [Acidobacteria bacterium]|nr:D-beta-D-heptose 1-phosphate adenosyltransferase [Acidobacteriota bacterium]